MITSHVKMLGATALAYIVLGGVQTLGQPGGLRGSQKPAKALPDADERQAAPTRAANEPAHAVNRFADVLKRHPVQRRAAEGERLRRLYMMDLVAGETTLIADEPAPGFDFCGSPQW